jgi:serine phosphatase RsbU (regulator of sigma subunit)
MLRLHVDPAHGEPYDFLVESESVVIGRASSADLVIPDRFLSRHHAKLYRDGEEWFLEDLGSRNGTVLNQQAVERPSRLRSGDQIRFSGSVISVGDPEAARRAPAEPELDLGGRTTFRPASEVLAGQSSTRSELLEEPESLRRYADRLRLLNEVHAALAGPSELSELLDLILSRVFDHLQPEEGVIFMRDAGGGYFRAASRASPDYTGAQLYSGTLVEEVAEKGLAGLVFDVETDDRFGAAQSILDSGVRSLVAAPLIDPDGSLGMIALSSRIHRRQFTESDMELLVSLASVAALRIRNVALAEEAAERQRMQEELRLARQIQLALLPAELPEAPGWNLYGRNDPSRGVSGDFFQVVVREDQKDTIIMVADVSGKGIGAALLTASFEALAAGPIEVGCSPDEICERVCRRLYVRTPPAKYATGFVASLDFDTGTVRYCNAGHNAALLLRSDGTVEQLTSSGMPIGLMPATEYTAREATLQSGDTLVIYTDGITEATDPDDQEFGLERLEEICRQHLESGLADIHTALERELEGFARGIPFADDRTLVMARRC